MRINILIAGAVIFAVSVLLLPSEMIAFIFGFALGALNMIIAILTPRSVGVVVPMDPQSPLKLSLDKGVIRTNIYTVAFSEEKLVLRKLGSAYLTVATALILALLGAALAGAFGVIVGGVTAFSLQEFVTHRRRDEVKSGNILDTPASGDLEFSYSELERIGLLGNRIQINLKGRIVRIAISRKYSRKIGPLLEKIIPPKIQLEPIPSEQGL